MDKDSKTIDIKLPTRLEDLYNSLSQGCSIDGVKEFLEENLGWQFCGIIADALDKKNFSRNQ